MGQSGMEEESGFCASTGIYHSHWDSATATPTGTPPPQHHYSSSLPDYLFSTTTASPSKPAFVDADTGAALSFEALRALSSSVSRALLTTHGVSKGDAVLLVAPNSLHFPALALGIMSAGAVFSAANFLHTRQELRAQVLDCNPKLILTTPELHSKLDGLGPCLLLIPTLLLQTSSLVDDDNNGAASGCHEKMTAPEDVATFMYSSGTTGKSKTVVSTHANLVAASAALKRVWAAARGGEGDAEVFLCVVPLFHMFGFSTFVCGAVAAGATTVVAAGRFSAEGMACAAARHGVTKVMVVPPMVVEMVKRRRAVNEGGGLGPSLKEVSCSGAPLAVDHMRRFADCYPNIRLSQCYGLTEANVCVTLCDGVKGMVHPSIGRLISSFQAKIVDVETRNPLPPYKLGELHIRGPSIMRGYLNNREATSVAIDGEGWLRTGDLCYVDGHGLVYVVDRIKELIKYKAYQVAPAELEEVLSSHPDITDVAVVPYPDEEAGEIPMACVVRRVGSDVREQDIISFIEHKVAPYKKVRRVVFVEFVPRSPSGKILRRRILKRAVSQPPPRPQIIPSRL